MGVHAVISSAGHRRIDRAQRWLENRAAAEEVLIIGATLDAANELARRVANKKGAAFGWHRLTLPQSAFAIAAPVLAARGLTPLTGIGARAFVARLVHRTNTEGRLRHYQSWVNHFGPIIAAELHKRRPKRHAVWHLDEVYLKIDGRMVYLWRAVDAEGEVLDVLVQSKRNKHAALKLMRKLLKKYAVVPERMVTDDLRSYGAATLDLGIDHLHDRGRWKNSRAENSHQPTRRRERKMHRFKSAGSAQKFLSTHAATYNIFNVQRHLTSAQTHRVLRAAAMTTWRKAVAAA
jgi:putative transposase